MYRAWATMPVSYTHTRPASSRQIQLQRCVSCQGKRERRSLSSMLNEQAPRHGVRAGSRKASLRNPSTSSVRQQTVLLPA